MRKHLSEMSLEEQTRLARLTFKNRYEDSAGEKTNGA